jgi:formate dehydrogenase major subunit
VNAQRGESNVQGSTDMGLLYHILPGYLGYPKASLHPTLKDYLEKETPKTSYWANKPKFLISLLKAWWGEAATPENEFAYAFLPKLDGRDHSHMAIFEQMDAGEIKGLFAWGQNPAVGGPQCSLERSALEKLDWLVAIDIFETETAAFWKRPGASPAAIKTEVFLLPAAVSYEKQGSISNSGRWIQWRYRACAPPGQARSDLWIADKLYRAIRAEYEKGGVFPEPILKLNWNYSGEGEAEPDIARVALEVNGYQVSGAAPLVNFTALAADGSTACGNWIYSGYYNDPASPPCKKRVKEKEGIGTHPDWGFAWPLNRRILYNRCASDPQGRPWNRQAPVVWWEDGAWKRNDVPDFGWLGPDKAMIPPEKSAVNPFIMLPEGQGRLFAAAMADGPFPEHYEPVESPVKNLLSSQQNNPVIAVSPAARKWLAAVGGYPLVATTFRVTEHWQSGIMTRNSPWLTELMPEMFVEISPHLAARLGVASGDKVVVYNGRSAIVAKACVTPRLQPLRLNGQQVEMIALPWHWGYQGLATGYSANELTPHVGDANTNIPEYKAFLCAIRRA